MEAWAGAGESELEGWVIRRRAGQIVRVARATPCRRASVVYGDRLMRREVEIVNELGLHARPAAEFVRCVQSLGAAVFICKGENRFSAASILEVLSANLDLGTRVILEVEGPEAQQALDRLEELLQEFRRQEERGEM
jgi:phosphocarrier protein